MLSLESGNSHSVLYLILQFRTVSPSLGQLYLWESQTAWSVGPGVGGVMFASVAGITSKGSLTR